MQPNGLPSKLPLRVVQKLNAHLPLDVLLSQIKLNNWFDEQVVKNEYADAKECIITVVPTDYGPEAVISKKTGNNEEITNVPGFMAAREKSEVSMHHELARAADYIGRKYVPRMGALRQQPQTYTLENVLPDIAQKKAVVTISSDFVSCDTEQEYWHFVAHSMVSKDLGRCVRILAEAYAHHKFSSASPHSTEEAWARDMTKISLYCLLTMLNKNGSKEVPIKQYKTPHGTYAIEDLEFSTFYNPEIRKCVLAGIRNVTVPLDYVKKVDSSNAQPHSPNPPQ